MSCLRPGKTKGLKREMTTMTLTTVRRAIAYIGLVVSAGGAGAQQPPPQQHPTRADLNGEWTGALELEGGTQNVSRVFRLTDSAFVGTVYSEGRKFGDLEAGSFSSDTVKFKGDCL